MHLEYKYLYLSWLASLCSETLDRKPILWRFFPKTKRQLGRSINTSAIGRAVGKEQRKITGDLTFISRFWVNTLSACQGVRMLAKNRNGEVPWRRVFKHGQDQFLADLILTRSSRVPVQVNLASFISQYTCNGSQCQESVSVKHKQTLEKNAPSVSFSTIENIVLKLSQMPDRFNRTISPLL